MDTPRLDETLERLAALVAFDTQNPPRRMGDDGIFAYLRDALGESFQTSIHDLGEGCVNLYARRGTPRLLFNFHIDTVPRNPNWTRDPFALHVADGRATGLGACDIKGAAAAMLTAARHSRGDVALLFSSDEEAGQGRCIQSFLSEGHVFDGVIVAEPTGGRAVLAHRGIGTGTLVFRGTPGHASAPRALVDSAVHEAMRWGIRALDAATEHQGVGTAGLVGWRFNAGRIEGGEKPNMIAGDCRVRVGVRPPPGTPPATLLQHLVSLAPNPERVSYEPGFLGPTLPAAQDTVDITRSFVEKLGLPVGDAVDFWTEAALFSAAKMPAIVFGPGHIEQAHTADEWVAVDELRVCIEHYIRMIDQNEA